MKRLRILAYSIWMAACLSGCGPERVAGGSGNGSETTNGITARFLYPDGRPARGLQVSLRPANHLLGDAPTHAGKARSQADTSTDSTGTFILRDLRAGDYVVEARGDTAFGLVLRVRISGEDPVSDLEEIRLERNGRVTGRIDRGSLPDSIGISVSVYGLDRRAVCGPDGAFRLSLAPGLYALKVTATDARAGSLEIPQVTCHAATETRLSDMSLPGELQADSLAVRAFLQAAGVPDADWKGTVGVEGNRIRTLNLKGLGLASLPAEIGRLGFLHHLHLDGNPLKSLPPALDSLQSLQSLSLERVPMDTLPDVVTRLAGLQHLHLGKTGLKDLPASLARLTVLSTLRLDSNGLTQFPSVLTKLPNLRDLELGKNSLRALPTEIGDMLELRGLSIHDNALDSLPESFGRLRKLIRLWAYRNRIQKLDASFGGLVSLEVLHLESNLLDSLPSRLGDLASLRLLAIGDNRLATLPEAVTRLKPVDGLSLWNNRLCSVPEPIRAWIDQYNVENLAGRTGRLWAESQAGCQP